MNVMGVVNRGAGPVTDVALRPSAIMQSRYMATTHGDAGNAVMPRSRQLSANS